MRSEKDQMTVGKEKSVVEIQFRDAPGEQDNTPGNSKQKEEKKEVFTKVGSRAFATCRLVHAACVKQTWREVGSFQHRGQRQEGTGFTAVCPPCQLQPHVISHISARVR